MIQRFIRPHPAGDRQSRFPPCRAEGRNVKLPGMSPSERYAQLRATAKIRERPLFPLPRNFSELELQARWFAGDFGRSFTSTAGEEIEIVQFGTWNREAGPDFSDAAIRIDRGEILAWSIEFDLADQNWETHGHATNPAFDETVLHVFVDAGGRDFLHPDNDEPRRSRRCGSIRRSLPSGLLSQSAAGATGTLSRAAARSAGGKNYAASSMPPRSFVCSAKRSACND